MHLSYRRVLCATASCLAAVGMFLSTAPANAFEDSSYASSFDSYSTDLIRDAGKPTAPYAGQSDDQLRVLAKQSVEAQNWSAATAIYEALVGRNNRDAVTWLALAEALEYSNPYSSHTVAAPYAAYLLADNDKLQAKALTVLARAMVRFGDGRRAIDAMTDAVALTPTDDAKQYLEQLQDQFGFRIYDASAQTDTDIPAICLSFSDPLADVRQVNYGDYVSVEPATPIDPRIAGSQLCLEGVSYGQDYTVTVRAGLMSRDGLTLSKDDVSQVTVEDRAATTAFYGNAYVLPRHGEGTLPLTTVNVSEVDVQLLRVNDRNLVPKIVQSAVGDVLWSSDIWDVANTQGSVVWTGKMSIADDRNKSVVTGIPVSTMLPNPEPGVYIVSATNAVDESGGDEYDDGYYYEDTAPATQWLVVTDLGLATFTGLDGLHVAVRSLDSAKPAANVKLTLIARNNEVLGEATSDADGIASFASGVVSGEGGDRPAAVLAYGQDDFSFLELTGSGFDLSDRGVSGRPEPGPLDAYLYTERGVYRPGETVMLTALLRDERANALTGLPLTIRLVRPDGVEAQVVQVADTGGGGHEVALPIPSTAYTGVWTAEAYVDPKGDQIGSVTFQVEDFVPARIRVAVTAETPVLREGLPTNIDLAADFLYGAPAADLTTEAEVTIREASTPWPDYADYHFGLVQDDAVSRIDQPTAPSTDEEGKAVIPVTIAGLPDTTRPLEAVIRGSVFDAGGRPANDTITLPIRRDRPSIGIKPGFDWGLPEGADAAFDLIALDSDGNRIASDVSWTLIRETYDYQWYNYGSNWSYDTILREQVIAEGKTTIAAADVTSLSTRVDWGDYRIDIYDAKTGAASSVRFSAGWWMSDDPNPTPDKLTVALDRTSYAAGDTMKIHVTAPFAGEALVVVGNDRILATRNVTVGTDGTELEIPVGEGWGAGAYVMATAFRPGAAAGERAMGPARAVGLSWFGIDVTERTLAVAIDAPAEILPRQTIQVPVTITGAAANQPVWLTLAAVDEGILLLTDFESPDPTDHYYGRRALGLDLRDAYGRLIISRGQPGTLRVGGDEGADQRPSLTQRSTQTVALYSGIVQVGPDGKAIVPLNIPDFTGELRLMAVAWGAGALGEAEKPLTVRDPVIAEMVTPRFLAPGDTSNFAFTLRNLSGEPGTYTIDLATGAPLRTTSTTHYEQTLAVGDEARLIVPVTSDTLGVGTITASITGPGGFSLSHEWSLTVRAPQPLVTERVSNVLAPGESATFDGELLRSFLPGTTTVSASLSTRPSLDIPGLLQELDAYPYGCVEQTTSRALPLLYVSEIAEKIGSDWQVDDLNRRIQEAVDRILTMQSPQGGFGVWSAFDSPDVWLSAYATDFLLRARDQGFRVPDRPINNAVRFLTGYLDSYDARNTCNPTAAFALYVLSRAGAGNVGDMRYLVDTCLAQYRAPLAQAQLGAAAAQFGDQTRASEAFSAAMSTARPADLWTSDYYDYGSDVRDHAGIATLLSETGQPLDQVLDQTERAADGFNQTRWHSTQDLAWMVLAANAALKDAGPLTVSVNGRATTGADGSLTIATEPEQLEAGIAVDNTSDDAVRSVVSIRGVPAKPQPASSDGFTITRTFLDRQGRPVDPSVDSIAQGDLITVLVRGTVGDDAVHRALIVDLLPAGFEIENPDLGDAPGLSDISATLSATTHTEMRDDRFVAALDFYGNGRDFAVAYLVRAVTPGSYVLPPAYIEDMYAPQYSGRTAMGRVTIVGK
jgi:uncharacterized protein YfaS (alpha-2-macroglobulin family)